MGELPIPTTLLASRVQQSFGKDGPTDESFPDRSAKFLEELPWWIEATPRWGDAAGG
jgi:hypothetical protein